MMLFNYICLYDFVLEVILSAHDGQSFKIFKNVILHLLNACFAFTNNLVWCNSNIRLCFL